MCLKSRSLAFMAKLDFCRWKFLRQRISRLPLGLDVGFRTNSLLLDFPSVDSLFCLVCFFIFLYFWCWKFVCQQNWRPSPPYKSRLSLFPCLFLAQRGDSLHYGDQSIQTKPSRLCLNAITVNFLLKERALPTLWGPEDSNKVLNHLFLAPREGSLQYGFGWTKVTFGFLNVPRGAGVTDLGNCPKSYQFLAPQVL